MSGRTELAQTLRLEGDRTQFVMIGFRQPSQYKPRVLVVDDDPIFDGLVVDHLTEDDEYHVVSARSGEQALKILEQSSVDVLITDIKMPNKDGFELISHVRQEFPQISVIVVSGFGRPPWLDEAASTGSLQFLDKPVNFARLKKLLRKAAYDAVAVPGSPQSSQEKADVSMLRGQVAQFPVLDMIQICCIAERTGSVTLLRGARVGHIYLEDGEIVHAETDRQKGKDAFFEMCEWDDADFSFQNGVMAPSRTIRLNWESLVYLGIQRRTPKAA